MNVCHRSRHGREKRIEMRTKRECFNCAKEDFFHLFLMIETAFLLGPIFFDNLFSLQAEFFSIHTNSLFVSFSRSTHHCDDDDRNLCVDRLKIAFLKNSASLGPMKGFFFYSAKSRMVHAHMLDVIKESRRRVQRLSRKWKESPYENRSSRAIPESRDTRK